MEDSDMDALLSNIDFDECMDVEEAANGIDVDANGEVRASINKSTSLYGAKADANLSTFFSSRLRPAWPISQRGHAAASRLSNATQKPTN